MLLHSLGDRPLTGYTTWGCMWEKERCRKDTEYQLKNQEGKIVPMQSRITAWWPDGSVKWTAHTADSSLLGKEIEVVPNAAAARPEKTIRAVKKDGYMDILAGSVKVKLALDGSRLFDSVFYDDKEYLRDGALVLLLEEPSVWNGNPVKIEKRYNSRITDFSLEEEGDLQVILKYGGYHEAESGEKKLPFIVRMKIGLDSPRLDFVHTFLYDGVEEKDFLKGIGIVFQSPLEGSIYNRHVKFMGDYGVFHESMAQLCTWRPRVPQEIYASQVRGEVLKPCGEDEETVNTVLKDMPFWSEYDLCQDSVSHFSIKKKIKDENCCYLNCLHGTRTEGGAAFGSEHGSVLVSIRDFFERYPSGYTFRNLDGDMAEAFIWFWSPKAEAMDFRHYANRGYNQVYYEGFDYKGATPYGIACTSECSVFISKEMIPEDQKLKEFAESVKRPALYVGTPEYYHERKAFGYWSLPARESEMERWLENQLDLAVDFYQNEVAQRNWYGMFDYGDFMHTYDKERHQWRYDMGGYAWDNTELVPTLWLWYEFMRTGREDVFVLAEKLSKHTSEVDVYHLGKWKGLGSRHNVSHWGCPCKEARISMAAHHRFYYYLTGDRRLEDIFTELKDNEKAFLNRDPLGDFYDREKMVYKSHARSGPDWSSLCANWMTQWERFNDETSRDKIRTGIEDIKKAPLKLVSGPDFEFNPEDVHLRYIGERASGGTHLQICMGSPQIWMEMADLLDDEEWRSMLADYGRFYYLPGKQQLEESGGILGDRKFTLPYMAAAMGAYGAVYRKDEALAETTWSHLLRASISQGSDEGFRPVLVSEQGNQKELSEIPWITTNFAAQWCLNVIVALEFIRSSLPKTVKKAKELAGKGKT